MCHIDKVEMKQCDDDHFWTSHILYDGLSLHEIQKNVCHSVHQHHMEIDISVGVLEREKLCEADDQYSRSGVELLMKFG